jgi:hypothetical protein
MLTTFFTWLNSLIMFYIYRYATLAYAKSISQQKADLNFSIPTLGGLTLITTFTLCRSCFVSRLLTVVAQHGGLPAGISKGLPAWMLLLRIKPIYNGSVIYFNYSERILVTPVASPQYIAQMVKQNSLTLYLPEATAQNRASQARGIQAEAAGRQKVERISIEQTVN